MKLKRMLWVLNEALLMSTLNIMFLWRNKKNDPRIIIKDSSLTSPMNITVCVIHTQTKAKTQAARKLGKSYSCIAS